MGAFLRFVVLFALLVAGFVLIALPLLLSPFLAGLVRDMGVSAGTLEVSVAMFDPGLVLGRSRQVTITAGGVDVARAEIGHIQVALGDASYFDRSFATISGEMRDISVSVGGETVSATSISVNGAADAAVAVALLAAPEVEQLILRAAATNGLNIDAVRVTNAGVRVTLRGVEADARLVVHGGALLFEPSVGGAVVLLQPAPSDPWSLTDSWFSNEGFNLSGVVDVRRVVRRLSGQT